MNIKSTILTIVSLFCLCAGICAQTSGTASPGSVKGRCLLEDGSPAIGVAVIEEGTTNGTVTDDNGEFSLTLKTENAVLTVKGIGYKDENVTVGNRSFLDVVLKEDATLLDDAIVVGFAVQKKVNLTGAVGTTDMKQMQDRPVKSATDMLQGLVPGLNVSKSAGGGLDTEPTINIRGVGTISSSSNAAPLVLIDGMEGSLNAVNPHDIESISVLKDASTASIYGSRAAFGVILVTTKSGEAGKTSITYNNNLRWNSPTNIPDMVDSYRFALYFNDGAINAGQTPHFSDERIQNILDFMRGNIDYSMLPLSTDESNWAGGYNYAFDNVDWYDALYKDNSFSHEHNISINGGSEKLRYMASANYLNQNGLLEIADDSYDRITTSLKLNSTIKKWLKANFSFRFVSEENEKPYYLNDTFFYDLARQGWPVLPLYDPNGHLYSSPSPALNLKDGGRINKKTDWLYQQVQFIIEPIENWKTFAEVNYRQRTNINHTEQFVTYNYDVNENPVIVNDQSHVNEVTERANFFNVNVYSEYDMTFNDSHHLKPMIGFQSELSKTKYVRAMRNGIIVDDLAVLDLTTGNDINGDPVAPTLNGSLNHWATAGFFGRVNYDYKSRYLIELNLRYDGTSRFRREQRWSWFPSVSAGWNIAEEPFMDKAKDIVDMLKLRGSYGVLGNQNTSSYYPTYQTMPLNNGSGAWLINNEKPTTSTAPALISSSLTWEKIKSWNVGFDFAFLKNRLSGSFDYYTRYTLDMVGPAPEMPATLGTAVPDINNTDLKTYGFELSLSWQDYVGEVGYSLNFMLSDSQTTILNYPNETGSLSSDIYRKGQKLGEIWGYETIGIARSQEEMDAHLATLPNGGQNYFGTRWGAGDIMYRDTNHDGKIDGGKGTESDPGDMSIIGNSTPRDNFTFDFSVEWKGIALSAMFQGVMKRDWFTDSYYFWGMGNKGLWWSTAFEEHMDYFRADPNHPLGQNIDSYYPRPIIQGDEAMKNQQVQTRYLLDASYIRLKNLQLSYTFPAHLTRKIHIENLRVYVSGENLWTGTRMSKVFDPETVDGRTDGAVVYPLFKVWSAGLSITF